MKNHISPSFFLILSVLLSGFFKILTFFISFNLNYFLIPLFSFYLLCLILLKRKIFFSSIDFFYIVFIVFSSILFLINNTIFNNNYSEMQLLVSILLQFIIPFTFLLICLSNPKEYRTHIYNAWNVIIYIVFFTFFVYQTLLIFDNDLVLNFFVVLAKEGLIINPIQTSESGNYLRFSSIFTSSFTLAIFCCYSMIYIYFRCVIHNKKFIYYYLLITAIIFYTYNRNGLFVYLICSVIIFIYSYFNKYYFPILKVSFISTLVSIIVLPIFFTIQQDFLVHTSSPFTEDNALTKLSTLFSRLDAWSEIINSITIKDFLFGSGLVQGLNDTDLNFYVDNGYIYLLNQLGIFILIYYLVILSSIFFIIIAKASKIDKKNKNLIIESSMQILLIMASTLLAFLNNLFFEPIYIVLVLTMAFSINKSLTLCLNEKNNYEYFKK